jgi:8-oxo-dGTP pyrophosphatase MutT (NUDIX family)
MTFDCSGICLVKNKLVLLARRIEFNNGKQVPFGGYWSPFAGAIENGESPKDCAIRELKEESGFSINPKDVFFQKVIKRKKPDVNFNFFIGMVKEFPKIELDYEHTEFGIFKINRLKTLSPIDDDVLNCLKKYYKNAFPE